MVTETKRNIWRSERLIFRPVEPTDDPFLESINHESSDPYQNATHLLPVPQGAASAKIYREFLEKQMIGCIICLPPPIPTENATASTTPSDPPVKPTPIGTISLMACELTRAHHRNTSIGITIAAPYQSQGYGSETVLWALQWAFRHANMHRVDIGAFAYNEGAWKLYERLGFVHEGRKRECVWYDGAYRDCIDMGMLRREWQERYGEGQQDAQTE